MLHIPIALPGFPRLAAGDVWEAKVRWWVRLPGADRKRQAGRVVILSVSGDTLKVWQGPKSPKAKAQGYAGFVPLDAFLACRDGVGLRWVGRIAKS